MKLTPVLPPREPGAVRLPEWRLPGRAWLVLGSLTVLALLAIALVPDDARAFMTRLGILVIGVAGAWLALGRAAVMTASSPEHFEDALRRPVPARYEIPGLRAVETDVRMSTANAFGVERRLKPVLRELAAWRLQRNHGIDVDRDPQRAEAILGDRLWALVKPSAVFPEYRDPGMPLADVQASVDRLEQV